MSNARAELVSGLKKDFATIGKRTTRNSVHLLADEVTQAVLRGCVAGIRRYPLRFLATIVADYSLLALDTLIFHEKVTCRDLVAIPLSSAAVVGIDSIFAEKGTQDRIRRTFPSVAAFLDRHPDCVKIVAGRINGLIP
jgi:hypothetical protein